MPLQSSAESPVPVRTASRLLGEWIRRTGEIWVEGQIAELKPRRSVAFLTLRDTDTDMSIPLRAPMAAVHGASLAEGHRVVARLRADYFIKNGSVSWRAEEFRPVGLGALMQRLEELRRMLAAEGLFRDERKRPLPFLPRRIGLVCGRGSAARHDVEVNARDQWPAADFVVREVAVQGATAVTAVVEAVRELDVMELVDVIVITRGGGSFEDLLPFSNEALIRAVSQCVTPVVSAIGHEEDSPILDQVADFRASTPTAAGRAIVPDLAVELERMGLQRRRLTRLMADRVRHERTRLDSLRQRPAFASPARTLTEHREAVTAARQLMTRTVQGRIRADATWLAGMRGRPALARPEGMIAPLVGDSTRLRIAMRRAIRARHTAARESLRAQTARLSTLSPQATLERGYAVVRRGTGSVVSSAGSINRGERLAVRVADGSFEVVVSQEGA